MRNKSKTSKAGGATVESVDTLVVGGGQAGIAMSEHLGEHGITHLVLERDRIAESWRTRRWDSLMANGPAWHDRFPNMEFSTHPDAFPGKEAVADYLVAYAKRIGSPIRTGVEVQRVVKNRGKPGFLVETSDGAVDARNIVAATGAFQTPIIPPVVPDAVGVTQIHSIDYRSPDGLPEGGVLVVGSGSSGAQIADDLLRAGRKVWLSMGPHDRPPRSYRRRDYCWWLGVLGKWDTATIDPDTEHVTIAVSGAHGGETVDFRQLAARGATLMGRTQSCEDGVVQFAPDLARNIAGGDQNYLALLQEADDWITRNGMDLPEEPDAHNIGPDPDCVTNPILQLDLKSAGVTSIVWATGYRQDFGWLQVDAFDADGRPQHLRGVSTEAGVYFLGLPWLSRRGSSFIWGVWHDAKYIADHIATQRAYLDYRDETEQSAGKERGAE